MRTDKLRWFGAATRIVVLIVGVPILLARLVGWPLPRDVPTYATIKLNWDLGHVPDRLITGTIAFVIWVLWAMFVVSVAVQIIGRVQIGRAHV